ncbi:DM13 domain-containing protein [Pseudarthrobacter sp. PS3-L1]|uniref:DM13 domain-containing protein n=1 Tax=Pseudarthrobacter sp. PS3-L1 TaxID=3046207 RepID=UPI0024B8D26B|nr:DM13 domain-containing protein [Pseudarthrobacter sp. PS3-L1]MDJ0321551.1 DM13 domain-containing protein [Pseudarthrobacter sp. PS3-L1]
MATTGSRKKFIVGSVAACIAVALAVGLFLFQPWRVFTSSTVSEALPTSAATVPSASPIAPPASVPSQAPTGGTTAPPTQPPAAEAGPRILSSGTFISHEHPSKGAVRILELADGSRVLRLEGLDTSDGPDLRVWLSDAPVLEGTAGWGVFDDGAYADLGTLKANRGDQNYPIPPGLNLADFSSVSIWCARFAVSFAAAPLSP